MARDVGQKDYRPLGAPEVVAYTGTAGNGSAIAAGVKAVDVVCTTAAFIAIGKSAIATTSYMPVEAAKHYRYAVAEGDRVSAIQSASGGNVHIWSLV